MKKISRKFTEAVQNPQEVGRMRQTIASRTIVVMTFLTMLAVVGCGDYSPISPEDTAPVIENPQFVNILATPEGSSNRPMMGASSGMISAEEGGTISNGYYSLYFPPGALKEDTEISIEMPEFPKAMVRLGPHGIKFKKDVILSLPMDVIESDNPSIDVLWYNESMEYWESIGGYYEDGAIKAELKHFSDYGSIAKG